MNNKKKNLTTKRKVIEAITVIAISAILLLVAILTTVDVIPSNTVIGKMPILIILYSLAFLAIFLSSFQVIYLFSFKTKKGNSFITGLNDGLIRSTFMLNGLDDHKLSIVNYDSNQVLLTYEASNLFKCEITVTAECYILALKLKNNFNTKRIASIAPVNKLISNEYDIIKYPISPSIDAIAKNIIPFIKRYSLEIEQAEKGYTELKAL